jgi:thiol-disulfide isomerase/thioredoxin
MPGGDTLPELVLPCLAGGPDLWLAALSGVPTVLTAWASWCLPCRRELPYFQRLADATRGRLRVLGVASDEPSMDDPLTFAAAVGVRFASGYDPAGRLRAARGIAGLPFTLLVRADGTVATVHIGPFGSAELAAAVQRQLGVSVGG